MKRFVQKQDLVQIDTRNTINAVKENIRFCSKNKLKHTYGPENIVPNPLTTEVGFLACRIVKTMFLVVYQQTIHGN